MAFPTPGLEAKGNFGAVGAKLADAPLRQIPVVTLDSLVEPDTRFVKIDVEGAEDEVLDGAGATLRGVRPAWLIEANSETIAPRLIAEGYRAYWMWDAFVTPLAPKAAWTGNRRGDLCILGVPRERPQPGGMVEIEPGQPRPTSTKGFRYLEAFGIRPMAD